jgi:hypothetical protein
MINGSFAEANRPVDGRDWVVDLPMDKPSSMALFLHIAHGHHQEVPRALPMHELYDLTWLTRFYDATRLLAPWIQSWVSALHATTVGSDESLPMMIWISWELGHRRMFEATVRHVTMEGLGALFAEGSVLQRLHMPSDIIGELSLLYTYLLSPPSAPSLIGTSAF